MAVFSRSRISDAELQDFDRVLEGAKNLDPRMLAAIHDHFYPIVYRYVRYRLDDEDVCEDITSEVFLRMLNALHKKRGPRKNLQGWLLGTASHLVNDHLRLRYRRKTESIEDKHLVSPHLPEQVVEDAFRQQEVRQAIQRLTTEQQHVLALRFSDDRTLEETAALMGKTIGAVKTLQFRALASLRRFLEERKK